MAFSFGDPAPAPAPASTGNPAAASKGFSFGAPTPAAPAPAGGLFGSTSAPAVTTDASAAGAAPPAGNLFGTAPSTAAPAPSGGLFSSKTTAPATGAAPTPATGGLFGAAPTPAPAHAGGMFGTAAPAAPTPAPAAGGLFGSGPAAAANSTSATPHQPVANIPAFHTTFPRLKTRHTVLDHVQRVTGRGKELIHILSSEESGKLLSDPRNILKRPQDDGALKNALVTCSCRGTAPSPASGSTPFGNGGMFGGNQQPQQQQEPSQPLCVMLQGNEASITPSIAKDILRLSDELHISTVDAVALFAEANALVVRNEERHELEDNFVDVLIRNGKMGIENNKIIESKTTQMKQHDADLSTVVQAARHLFFHERAALLTTVVDLVRYRIQAAEEMNNTSPIIVATDQLLHSGLVTNLVATIRELNDMSRELRQGLKNAVAQKRRQVEATTNATSFGGGFYGGPGGNTVSAVAPSEKNLDMEFALLGFTQMQRHLAAECLFYLAYHTQLNANEVASLIDLIKDLTNGNPSVNDEGLPLLDPLIKDVPNPYKEESIGAFNWQQQQHYGWNKSLPLEAKDEKVWKEELISKLWARGQPQLLQCVSTLIMSVTCALDARHTLMNRQNHGPNTFGVGNTLLPPISGGDAMPSSLGDLQTVHSRLDPENQDAEKQWKRRDIWGLLLIPYALLIRNAAGSQLLSPSRGSRSSPSRSPPVRAGQMNMKATCTKCLVVASQLKSLTFARMSLIPSFGTSSASKLEKHGVDSSVVDFYISVFADFTSQFIDALCATGNLPITRKEWYDEEFNLAQTEWAEKEQRRQFGVWAGQTVEDDTSGPREVNILDRPDCLEDIFALVSSFCSTHPEGSKAFWKIVEHQELDEDGMPTELVLRLAPSRFLERLDLIHADSDSLLFVYLSFLSSLALAEGTNEDEATNGASTIHSFLCGERTINPYSERHVSFGWANIISAIRWYAEQLSPDGDEKKKSSTDGLRRTSSNIDTSETSTSYYYGVSNSGVPSTSSSSPQQGRPSTPDDPKSKELDEVGTNTLASLLCLVCNVAARSSVARENILGIQLPVQNSDSSTEVEGSLEILFSLLTTAISTDIQGMTFMAIANLLQPTEPVSSSTEDMSKAPKRAWELLEMIQLIPIKLLENGSSNLGGGTGSSFAALGRHQKTQHSNDLPFSVFPPSADYGLIYQLEHLEAEAGVYPATEGFMYLLTTLIRTAGCPSDLGSQWRLRPGCLPYIEFVTNFILPRATGSMKNVTRLPFATVADEYRLVNRALEVIEAILVRYVVPFSVDNFVLDQFKLQYQSLLNVAKKDIGVSLIPEILRDIDSLDSDELRDAIQDFKITHNTNNGNNATAAIAHQAQSFHTSNANQIPLPKSPGFCIMAKLLSFNESSLLNIIHKILYQHGGSNSVHKCGEDMTFKSVAAALFRETPPNIDNSKRGIDCASQKQRNQLDSNSYDASISSLLQSMIKPVHPLLLMSCTERNGSKEVSHSKSATDAILWRERSILLALRILAAAVVREGAFTHLSHNAGLRIVPTLSFKGPIHGSYAHRLLEEDNVYVAKLSSILTKVATATSEQEMLPLITNCVGYNASSLKDCQDIAKVSFCIVSYITHSFPQSQSVRVLCGEDRDCGRLVGAFSQGLLLPTCEGQSSQSIQNAILDLIISNIVTDSSSELNLSPFLNAILELTSDVSYVLNPATSSTAAKCFEVIFRIMQQGANQTTPVLPPSQFLQGQVMRYFGTQGPGTSSILHNISSSFSSDNGDDSDVSKRNNAVLHSLSWILKGLSLEIFILARNQSYYAKTGHESQSLTALLAMLFSHPSPLLLSALFDLPLGKSKNEFLQHSLNSLTPLQDALQGASVPLEGPSDVCARFEVVDLSKLSAYFRTEQENSKEEATLGWATAWNSFVARSCACSHISSAWGDLCRTATIVSRVIESSVTRVSYANTGIVTDILSNILLRLNEPGHFGQLNHRGRAENNIIEPESALPLSVAVLSLTNFLYEELCDQAETSEYAIADEDVSRICTSLESAMCDLSSNDERARILKCSLSQMYQFTY